jgi:hypothetical protein
LGHYNSDIILLASVVPLRTIPCALGEWRIIVLILREKVGSVGEALSSRFRIVHRELTFGVPDVLEQTGAKVFVIKIVEKTV